MITRGRSGLPLAVLLLPLIPQAAPAYSVLTHEAIIDSAWDTDIRPLLLARFPQTSPQDIVKAHAYAYGGCILQDAGYYPFGRMFFSDLVHYVRSGDFVLALIGQARDVNEYAFAFGALAHYAADNEGHALGVNRSVPLLYPKLRARYGDTVTFAENHASHLKTEFGFDVLQVARGRYAPQSYHDFIGFKVSREVLERAFEQTYGLKLTDVFASVDLALGTYRHTVSGVIPTATKVAWELKKDEIIQETPGMTRRRFLYNLSRASYEKEWDRDYHRPGIGAKVLAFVFRIIPKVGPFRAVSFKAPTPQTARLFEDSFNQTLALYRRLLGAIREGRPALPNTNLDTGKPLRFGEYSLADTTYSGLVRQLAGQSHGSVSAALRQNILGFYGDMKGGVTLRKKPRKWSETVTAIDKLRGQ